jgi:ABC-type amino acid transport substrate-binding protein
MLSGDFSNLSIMENIECDTDTRIYAVGFKKGSQLVEKVNDALKQLYENGKISKESLGKIYQCHLAFDSL